MFSIELDPWEAPPKMEDVVAVVVVVVVDGAVEVEVEAGFAPPKDGALDDGGVPPKIDPDDGFEGVAPKTEPDVAPPPPPDVEDAPKVPLVGVPVTPPQLLNQFIDLRYKSTIMVPQTL